MPIRAHFGLRLDLTRLEALLPVPASLVALDNAVHAFVTRARSRGAVREALVAATGLPAGAVHVHEVDDVPTTDRGKPDHVALARQARTSLEVAAEPDVVPGATPQALRDLYAAVLEKMELNRAKYPADKVRGDPRKYSDYPSS